MKLPFQILLIAGLAGLLAFGHKALVGGSAPVLTDDFVVTVEEVMGWGPVIWIDARVHSAFEEGHVPGAHHLNEDNWEDGLNAFIDHWDPDRPIVVYCEGESCQASQAVAERLREEFEIEAVYWLKDGWTALDGKEDAW